MKIASLVDETKRQRATEALAKGKPLVLEGGGFLDEKLVHELASLPGSQRDIAAGNALGTKVVGTVIGATLAGTAAEIALERFTDLHPAAGALCRALAVVVGGYAAYEATKRATLGGAGAVAPGTPLPPVRFTYDPKAQRLVARLEPQPAV